MGVNPVQSDPFSMLYAERGREWNKWYTVEREFCMCPHTTTYFNFINYLLPLLRCNLKNWEWVYIQFHPRSEYRRSIHSLSMDIWNRWLFTITICIACICIKINAEYLIYTHYSLPSKAWKSLDLIATMALDRASRNSSFSVPLSFFRYSSNSSRALCASVQKIH